VLRGALSNGFISIGATGGSSGGIFRLSSTGNADAAAPQSHKVSPPCGTDRAIILMYPIWVTRPVIGHNVRCPLEKASASAVGIIKRRTSISTRRLAPWVYP